jgi:hypothetical protein
VRIHPRLLTREDTGANPPKKQKPKTEKQHKGQALPKSDKPTERKEP